MDKPFHFVNYEKQDKVNDKAIVKNVTSNLSQIISNNRHHKNSSFHFHIVLRHSFCGNDELAIGKRYK